MLLDANDLEDGAEIVADLCIVGAGAAGVTLAHALRDAQLSIALLESGGLEFEEPTQALYEGSYVGIVPTLDAGYLSSSRWRMFGGTTNLWGGYTHPLSPLDFEARAWVADSGWPISRTDLDAYYRNVSSLLTIAVHEEAQRPRDDPEYPAQFGEAFEERLYQVRYVNVARNHLEELRASQRATVVLHANALEVMTSAGGNSVDHVAAGTLGGKRIRARARVYVLASGGIENARILLASRSVRTNGVGNDHDLVGRCFMEHLVVALLGPLFVWQEFGLKRYQELANGEVASAHFLAPSAALLRERGLLNITAQLGVGLARPDTFTDFDRALMRASFNFDGHGGAFVPPQEAIIQLYCEQAPNRDSRITLSDDRDPLGMPRVRLDWRFGDLELDTIAHFAGMLSAEFGNRRLGRMRAAATRDDLLRQMGTGGHHMGTTRMHPDPQRGVVDANCQVHGVDNLFVAGSSVFPTSGSANPTYTLLALALRLADHLRGRLS